jgi:hypothetical protein
MVLKYTNIFSVTKPLFSAGFYKVADVLQYFCIVFKTLHTLLHAHSFSFSDIIYIDTYLILYDVSIGFSST